MSRMLHALASLLFLSAIPAAAVHADETALLQTGLEHLQGNGSAPDEQLAFGKSKAAATSDTHPEVQSADVFRRDYLDDNGNGNGQGSYSSSCRGCKGAFHDFHMRNVVAEYVAMTLFVVIGCGSAMAIAKEEGSAWILQVALAFGFAITVLAYSLGRYSGGQINCAVTLGLWVYGRIGWAQALFNFIAQMLGSITGAALLLAVFPKEKDKTGGLGTNSIAEGYSPMRALVGEFIFTFLLMLVVFESSEVEAPASAVAVICIGLAVFLAHVVLIPVDGCSINPTRSFGPSFVLMLRDSKEGNKAEFFANHWVFWVGPLVGALAAAGVHKLFTL